MQAYAISSILIVLPLVWGAYKLSELEIDISGDYKIFTKEDMAKFDGSNPELPIYMGIRGVVFDVSAGAKFYGKDAMYNALVGKDSTRAVAKMSLDPSDLIHDISGLSDAELESLDNVYRNTYVAKYPIAGYMDYLHEELSKKSKHEL